ncbi:hypothetical protein LINPERHAP2_LOCUS34792 [Linum perenne]
MAGDEVDPRTELNLEVTVAHEILDSDPLESTRGSCSRTRKAGDEAGVSHRRRNRGGFSSPSKLDRREEEKGCGLQNGAEKKAAQAYLGECNYGGKWELSCADRRIAELASWILQQAFPLISKWAYGLGPNSVIPNSGDVVAGGVVCDELGRCLAAFSSNLGGCSITRAKLCGVIVGMDVAWEIGIRRVAVQVDSMAAIVVINEIGEPCHQHAAEVVRI